MPMLLHSEHEAPTEINGLIHLDLSTIKKPTDLDVKIPKPVWLIKVDAKTGLKFTDFYKTKAVMVELTAEWIHKTTLTTNPVQVIRMDNAGKNKKLAQCLGSVDWKLSNIKIEYTARDTPQHNHLAELAFATIANRGRTLMVHANIPLKLRYKFCAEVFKVATLLDGFSIVAINGKSQSWFEHYTGCKPSFAKFLRIWG
jgi:hypothetical protein